MSPSFSEEYGVTKRLIKELRDYQMFGEVGPDEIGLMMRALARLLELHLFWAKGEQ